MSGKKVSCGCGALAMLAMCGLYQAAYFLWLSLTPITPERLTHVTLACYFWLGITLLALLGGIGMLVWVLRKQKP